VAVTSALSIENLSYSYPNAGTAIENVSFSIASGERVALLGANGAGKSTLLWCLVGVLPAQGRVWVGGTLLGHGTEREIRRNLALAFSEPDDQLFMLTVERDVTFGPLAAGDDLETANEKALRAAAEVGLRTELMQRPPHELSSGEKRRAALAAILVSGPKVLALDEPTNSLDAPGRQALAETLAGLDCAQLIATHDLGFASQLCTRALVMVEGRLVDDTDLSDLLADRERLIQYGLATESRA